MERTECEAKILEKLREIVEIYHGYNPEGHYLTLCYDSSDGEEWTHFNNAYWANGIEEERGEDAEKPLDFFTYVEKPEREAI